MDFDAELETFLNQTDMKDSLHKFAMNRLRFDYQTELAIAKTYAEQARNAIVSSLPDSLKYSKNGAIGVDDLIIFPGRLRKDGVFVFELGWNPTVIHRDSLYEDGYPDGIEDIVGLLTTGYSAKNYVYGLWFGHSPSMDVHHNGVWKNGTHQLDPSRDFVNMRSRKQRAADKFLQRGIDAFNRAHISDGVKVSIMPSAKYY